MKTSTSIRQPQRKSTWQTTMRRWLTVCSLIMVMAPSGWAGEPPDNPIDCDVYKNKKTSITLGFRIGNMLLNAGPDVTLSEEESVDWDRISQALIARYVEACIRYNAGALTKEEYETRIQQIEVLQREARELEERQIARVRDRKHETRRRMENLLRKKSEPKASEVRSAPEKSLTLSENGNHLAHQIEAFESLSRKTLRPSKPSSPPDSLGPPAVSFEEINHLGQ